jgi:hypothetical protein
VGLVGWHDAAGHNSDAEVLLIPGCQNRRLSRDDLEELQALEQGPPAEANAGRNIVSQFVAYQLFIKLFSQEKFQAPSFKYRYF